MSDNALRTLLEEAKALAKRYRALTGKPLGITGEVAEYEAARLLSLDLAPARQPGYDALENTANGIRRLQVKGRCLVGKPKPGQRIGSINIRKEWDATLLVLLNEEFEAT